MVWALQGQGGSSPEAKSQVLLPVPCAVRGWCRSWLGTAGWSCSRAGKRQGETGADPRHAAGTLEGPALPCTTQPDAQPCCPPCSGRGLEMGEETEEIPS